ncbi:MAG: helix-turn-helix transcriptional regulator [Algiphilus sp.]
MPAMSNNVPRVIRLPEVQARVGMSRSAIYAAAARGDFPRPFKLGPRASGWLADEVDAWLRSRVAVREEAA